MKKLIYALVLTVSVGTLVAGGDGKSCAAKSKAKSVELTGQVVCTGAAGEDCNPVFRVANSDTSYSICHSSKISAKQLTSAKGTYKVTGKIIHCGDGEELVIDKASKI